MNTPTNPAPIHPFQAAGLGLAPFKVVGFEVKKFQACYGAPIQCGTSCDFCATGIMNVFWIASSDGKRFKVGCDCVARTGDAHLKSEVRTMKREFAKDQKRAKRARENAERATAFLADKPELAEALEAGHDIVRAIKAKLAKYGSVSAAQIALVTRLAAETSGSMQLVAEPPAVPVPAVSGRVVIEGRILAKKCVESAYGSQMKMLLGVRTPEGQWKAWSTIPAGAYTGIGNGPQVGDVLRVKAAVEVSDRDPGFAFLKRPAVA